MLDQLNYTKNEDGSFTKTVSNTSIVTDAALELDALKATVTNLQIGQSEDPSDEVAAAINNYIEQIGILEA